MKANFWVAKILVTELNSRILTLILSQNAFAKQELRKRSEKEFWNE